MTARTTRLKAGDLVKLKSGGPLMTVNLVAPDNSGAGDFIQVVWTRDDGSMQRENLFPGALKKEGGGAPTGRAT